MSSKLSRRRKGQENHDLELTTFLNLLVVLISFLLVTSVFSRIAIQELKLPTAAGAGGAIDTPPPVTIEVVLRNSAVQVQVSKDGKTSVTASFPKSGDSYELDKLSEYLQGLKSQYADKNDATLLIEPDIAYEHVIHVMDTVKMARVQQPGQESMQKIPLFPDVSVGDAP
jgi:biopolymer transport protein ExbD